MSGKGKESAPTEMYEDMRWLPPVASVQLLPTEGTRPGHTCFVIGESAIYEYVDGEWKNAGIPSKP